MILSVTKGDIQEAAGSLQLCVGQCVGAEAVVYAMRELFIKPSTEAVLLVDASNAFNSLNRQAALHNIRHLCPPIVTTLINTYRDPTSLFVDGFSLLSQEGTTQDDPLAMPMYAIATIPLICSLPNNVKQAWYADDASASSCLRDLRARWDKLVSVGTAYVYHANATKTWLITKQLHHQSAMSAFSGTHVNITVEGKPHLGAPLGSQEYTDLFVKGKVKEWCNELEKLASIAETQLHAVYAAITHGLADKWNYLSHTTLDIRERLNPLETTLWTKIIPALTGRPPPSDAEHNLLALSARLGGIGVCDPSKCPFDEYTASLQITSPLKSLISEKYPTYSLEARDEQFKAKRKSTG